MLDLNVALYHHLAAVYMVYMMFSDGLFNYVFEAWVLHLLYCHDDSLVKMAIGR